MVNAGSFTKSKEEAENLQTQSRVSLLQSRGFQHGQSALGIRWQEDLPEEHAQAGDVARAGINIFEY